MAKSKLPRTLGIVGVAIGLGFMAFDWYVDKYNPFHFPASASTPGNYSAPPLYNFLEDLSFVMIPGQWLGPLTADFGRVGDEIMGVIYALINFLIYFALGSAIVDIRGRIRPPQGRT